MARFRRALTVLLLAALSIQFTIASQPKTQSKPSTSSQQANSKPSQQKLPNLPDRPPKDESEIPEEIVDLYSDPSMSVAEKWALIGQFYNDFAWPHRRKIIEYLEQALSEPKLSFGKKCKQSLALLKTGLNESTLWAFESECGALMAVIDKSVAQ